MDAFHAVKRPMEGNKGVHQADALRVGQAGIQESQFGRGQKACISRHVQSDEHGIPIYEAVVQIIRTGVKRNIIRNTCRQDFKVGGSLEVFFP
jgi:hypothetical protein